MIRWTESARRALVPAAIVVATFAAYAPAMNGTPLWDDDVMIEILPVRRADGLPRIWTDLSIYPQYYPLTLTSFWAQWRVWSDHWIAYHLLNVLLHAASALLLGWGLKRLGLPGAWLAAALFALHPIQVESVAWMNERKNVLSGFFFFAAAHTWWSSEHCTATRRRRLLNAASLALLVAALLSKATTATLPFALLVICWWKRGRLEPRTVLRLAPHFAAAIGMGVLSAVLERIHTGAQGAPFHLSVPQRFLIMGRASWFYLGKLVFPFNLSFIYPRWTVDPRQAWQWVFLLAAGVGLGLAWCQRRRWGRGPLAALLFFGGVLFPALGFLNVYPFLFSFVADHFQYLACAAPLAALAYGATVAVRWLPRAASLAAATCLVVVLGLLTSRRADLFSDSVVLWRATLEQNPSCGMCQSNLGKDLADRDRPGEALIAYRAALADAAPRPENLENDIGVALLKLHRPREAELALRAAIRLLPNHVTAWINLGDALAAQGRQPEAQSTYEYALRLKPSSVRGNTRMGAWLLSQGRPQEAATYFQQALTQDPDAQEARDGLSRAERTVAP